MLLDPSPLALIQLVLGRSQLLKMDLLIGRCHDRMQFGASRGTHGHGTGSSRSLQQVHDLQSPEPQMA